MRRSFAFIFGMIAFVVVTFGVYFPVLTKYRNLKIQEEEMDSKIRDLDEKIKKLADEKELLKNDKDYLEKVIRQELGLVKPGEIVYKFVTDPSKPKTAAKPAAASSSAAEEPSSGLAGTTPVAPPEEVQPTPEKTNTQTSLNSAVHSKKSAPVKESTDE